MKTLLASTLIIVSMATVGFAQSRQDDDRPKVHIDSYSVDVTLNPAEHRLDGVADIRFHQLERRSFITLDLDRRLRVSKASVGTMDVNPRQFDLDSSVEFDLADVPLTNDSVLHVEYSGVLDPEDDAHHDPVFAKISGDSAFLLYDGKWFPTNGLYGDKSDLQVHVNAPAGWTVVSDLSPIEGRPNTFASKQPGFYGMISAGKYNVKSYKTDHGDIIASTVRPPDAALDSMADAAGKIIDYYTSTFGPMTAPSLRIVEVEGANWDAKYSAGTLLLPTSQFRKDFDNWALARTLAHQWFPLKISVKDPEADAWLVDGMCTFASLQYLEKTLSPADAQEFIDKALVKALSFEGNGSIRKAGAMQHDSPDYTSLVVYRGAYVLRMLRWVMGDDKFNLLISQYVDKYAKTPASTEGFAQLASQVNGEDLTYFFDEWLNSTSIPEMKTEYTVFRTKDGAKVVGQIKQDLDLFRMPVELEIETDGEPEYRRIDVSGSSSDFEVTVDRKPKPGGILIDPHKKILRMSNDIRIAVVINRGEEFANTGEYNRAMDEYQKAIDIQSNNSLASFRMGEASFELGNLQLAANVFRDALNGDLKPKWVEVWCYINLGKIYDIRGDRQHALQNYNKAANTGDDAYGAQAEAQKYIKAPYRREGKPTMGD